MDVEDLQTLYERIDSEIKLVEHEAQIEIRALLLPTEALIDEAVKNVMANLTAAAEPYWTAIASLEAEAEATGQKIIHPPKSDIFSALSDTGEDISVCINAGNGELYALNDTTVNAPLQKIFSYRTEANDTIYASSTLAYSAIEELLELELRVKACSESACAEELFNALIDFHGRAEETLYFAVDNPYTYLNELPEKLAPLSIDAEEYKQKYTAILEAVVICDIL